MPYGSPGHADELSEELIARWNDVIVTTAESLASFKTRFFELDPAKLRDPELSDAVKWPGDPAAPTFCVDEPTVRALCDWPEIGRRSVQLEYCECAVINARDAGGRLRPKRVEVTTELREYWSCIAMHDPDRVRAMAADVLGREPDWEELFGVADPHPLSPEQREIAFGHTVGGHGNNQRLIDAGVPAQPTGRLNIDHALFMTHPINGLDDFLYVVMFGSHPYGVRAGSQIRQATGDDIYTAKEVKHLSCNHADPTITLGAYDNAFAGRQTASLIGVKHQASETGVPVLSEALAFLSCQLVDAFDGGDHVILVGQVIELGTLRRHREPLIFFRGALGALETEPHGAHSIFDG